MNSNLSEKYPFMVTVPWPYERTIVNEDGITSTTCHPDALMRPKLELKVGRQGTDWEWDICSTDINCLDVFFINYIDAIEFKLTWS